MQRVIQKVLDDLTGHHQIEGSVGVREGIALGIEVIDKGGEGLIGELDCFAIHFAQGSEVGPAHFLVTA